MIIFILPLTDFLLSLMLQDLKYVFFLFVVYYPGTSQKNVELDLIIECLLGFTKFSFSRFHFTLNYSNNCNFKSLQSLSQNTPTPA